MNALHDIFPVDSDNSLKLKSATYYHYKNDDS